MSALLGVPPACFLSLGGENTAAAFEVQDDEVILRFEAPAGLYQFSVVADASEFQWDALYKNLYAFNNNGRRTGPWDFDPTQQNLPLMPSYWVFLNGERLGLWFFQRVSLDDIRSKRFRGRIAFWVRDAGAQELTFVPHRPLQLRWLSSRLETDPEDTLLPLNQATGHEPLGHWTEAGFWREKQAQLETTHRRYKGHLETALKTVLDSELPAPNEWPVLIAGYRVLEREAALQALLKAVDECLYRPHWGNPREDGYGHDGDMAAAFLLRGLTWAYFSLADELGEERRERLRQKVALQGNRFLDLALLNRDYWGGSVLQDHGWRSMHTFAFVALCWLDQLPEASEWLRYALPRSRRALDAMPRDGVVPQSSHDSVILYLDDISDLRDALMARGYDDIYETYPFRSIIDFLCAGLDECSPVSVLGGNGFLNQMAAKYHDGRAACLQEQLLEGTEDEWYSDSRRHGYHAGIVRGFLTYNPAIAVEPPAKQRKLTYFPDSGLAYFCDPEESLTLAVRCGPWVGYHADRHATGPCDRMGMAPGAGHFVLRLRGRDLLASPDPGYALQSVNKSCLLVNGAGQRGDVGYPMSIPSWRHSGEEIECVRWDEAGGTGYIRLHLTPAYPAESEVAHYTREFLIAQGKLTVRDFVVLSRPAQLSWLFQSKRDYGLALHPETAPCAQLGGKDGLTLRAKPQGTELAISIQATPVVWSYVSSTNFKPFDHVRFDSIEPVTSVQVDFELAWN